MVEFTWLHKLSDKALDGERQIVFVTGELGIGKTTVVGQFREQLRTNGNLTIGYDQCIEHYGPEEPYLSVLEAMGRLCREAVASGSWRCCASMCQPGWCNSQE